jgi:hypothetical protein
LLADARSKLGVLYLIDLRDSPCVLFAKSVADPGDDPSRHFPASNRKDSAISVLDDRRGEPLRKERKMAARHGSPSKLPGGEELVITRVFVAQREVG